VPPPRKEIRKIYKRKERKIYKADINRTGEQYHKKIHVPPLLENSYFWVFNIKHSYPSRQRIHSHTYVDMCMLPEQ
jgi:hypothetical protein